jgi:uncharacterized membrane protein YjgN (DUF898 family)
MDKLLYVSEHINREKYPKSARMLDLEIARRQRLTPGSRQTFQRIIPADSAEKQPQQKQTILAELPLEFRGSAREYFKIWIVNLCLTLLTFGIFSAWAKVRKKRYAYSHTTIDGTPFQYLGQPVPILKGRLIAVIGFLLYFVSSRFVTFLLPWVLGAGLVVAPWVLVRSAGFNARYSAFRNMTFHFEADYWDAVKVLYAWGIVPIWVFTMMVDWGVKPLYFGIISLVGAIYFPWLIWRLKKFIIEHTFYGGKYGIFSVTGGQYFKVYFLSALIIFGFTVPLLLIVTYVMSVTTKMWLLTYISSLSVYAGYVLAYAYVKSRSGNLVWNNTRLGQLHFKSSLRCRDLLQIYITNALAIIASLGLAIPWAVIRTWKYRADNFRVYQEGALSQFRGSNKSTVGAFGAETLDIFDLDISI